MLTSDFDYIRGITGFSLNIELVASCLSFPTSLISLESKFYNSRYGKKSEERSDSNSSKTRQYQSKCLLTSDFDYIRSITGFSLNIELVASCLSFPTSLISLESNSITPDMVKTLRRGQTVTLQK